MEPHPDTLRGRHVRLRLTSVLSAETYPLVAILVVLWVGNYLYLSSFGFYEDDWYYMPSAFNVPLLATLHARVAQMFFQGRPLQVLVQGLVACAGAGLNSFPALYFLTFLLSAAKSILAYFVLRLRFDAALSTLTVLLFVISPLTTVRQSLNLELTAAPGYCFAFVSILMYVRRRRILAILAAVLALLTYEPMFFLFVAAPLFRRARFNREALMTLARHTVLCAAIFAAYFVWRRYAGESRSAGIPLGPALIWRLTTFDLIYSLNSFKSYLYGAYVGSLNLSIEAAFYTAAVCMPGAVVALRWSAETRERRAEAPELVGVAIGGALLLLAFALSYFQLDGSTTWPLAGRDTRVALAATFGSSLLVTSTVLLLARCRIPKLAKHAILGAFMLFLSLEFAYSLFIQQDYVSAWRHDVSLLNQAISLTPDASPDSTLIVDTEQKQYSMFPGAERMPSIGYQKHGLHWSLRVLTQLSMPVPKLTFVVTHDWAKSLEFGGDGMLHWRDKIVAYSEETLTPGRIILLKECSGGFLVRSERDIIVDGRVVQQGRESGTRESHWARFLQRPLVEKVLGGLSWYITAENTQAAKELADGSKFR
jgi:hypothetical protein